MANEKEYDSALVGWADPPTYNDEGELLSWKLKLKKHEIEDLLNKYATEVNDKGHGGNVYLTMFMTRGGKACCRVYDPNSEGAKKWKEINRLKIT